MKKTSYITTPPTSEISVGLHIDGSIKTGIAVIILKAVIALLGSVGSLMCLLTLTVSSYDLSPVYIGAALGILISIASALLPKGGNALMGAAFAGTAAVTYALRESAAIGGMYIFNEFYTLIKIKYKGLEFFDLTDFNKEEITHGVTSAIFIAALFVSLLTGFFLVCHTAVIPLFLSTFPAVEVVLYHGLIPGYGWMGAVICCWAASAAAEAAELPIGFKDKKQPMYIKASGQCAVCLGVIFAVCFVFAASGVRLSGFERTKDMLRFRREFSNYMATFSWDKFKNDLSAANPINTDLNGAINHGKLGRTDEITFTEETMLKLTVPYSGNNVYLKGFVGTVYTGNSWEELSGDAEKKQDEIISSFETDALSPSFMDGFSLEYAIQAGESLNTRNIFIEALGASKKNCYLPYYITPDSLDSLDITSDKASPASYVQVSTYDLPTGKRYDYLSTDPFAYAENGSLTADEKRYREFVFENYLDIPDTFTVCDEIYGDTPRYDLRTELVNIKMWLAANCEYDLAAGRLPFGKDFAQYFITENRKGSCSHFATAAALMCRYRGIPSRYAEGYAIKPEDFPDNIAYAENAVIEVTDERAHAWIEVYLDGYGWMPFEVTPGYGEIAETAAAIGEGGQEVLDAEPVPQLIQTTPTVTQTETEEVTVSETVTDDIFEDEDMTHGSTAQDESRKSENAEENHNLNPIPIIIIAVILILPVGLMTVRYKNITSARNRRLTGNSPKRKAHAAGKYFLELCAYKGLRKGRDESFEEFAERAQKYIAELSEGGAKIVLTAALESGYGENSPSADTANEASAVCVRFADSILNRLNEKDKFIFKYLRCLK